MALTLSNAKLSDFPLTNSSAPFSLTPLPRSSTLFLSHSNFPFPTLTFTFTPFSSLRTTQHNNNNNNHNHPSPKSNLSAPWLTTSNPSPKRVTDSTTHDPSNNPTGKAHNFHTDKAQNAVERIVLRLRNLGLTSDEEQEEQQEETGEGASQGDVEASPVTEDERLGELLRREWVRPDAVLLGEDKVGDEMVLPWEREEEGYVDEKMKKVKKEKGDEGEKGPWKRTAKAPTLAELTLEDELLRRLRREGMGIRERISVPKAGLTQDVMDKIHKRWRKEELVRLKFHEDLARDMKTAHQIVEVD